MNGCTLAEIVGMGEMDRGIDEAFRGRIPLRSRRFISLNPLSFSGIERKAETRM